MASDHTTTSSSADSPSSPTTTMSLENYHFPTSRLQTGHIEPGKTPLVLVACGSFSPITFLHLRMFSLAHDYVKSNTNFTVIGTYLSPVGDAYKKVGLAPAHHRLRMAELALQTRTQTTDYLMVDPWEAMHSEYMPTAKVLDHFEHEVNNVLGGVENSDGEKQPVRVALLAGADLIQTMSTPGVWSQDDLAHILGKYGAFVIERAGTDMQEAMGTLKEWEDNIYSIPQVVPNEISSTKIRLLSKRRMNIDYLVPTAVVDYIKEHGLYQDEDGNATASLKDKA
ncbi:nicotinamide/nicotinic acid mononucleotide adenylyltransferase [Apiospora rasikravindrae]|uniref:Nicotinamide-nucleotide adenylyltransferase n=1 Tax=Apiospora rasikravindrae TaxID=990691 RepID=A0ABR1THS6_9PEZI